MQSGSASTSVIFMIIIIIIIIVYSNVTNTEINYPVTSYTLAVIIFMMTTLSALYRSERLITAISTFITFLLIFVFFGLRWFKYGLNNTGDYKGNFPPVINTCPDYLSLTKKPNGDSACIDTIGVALNKLVLNTWNSDTSNPPNSYYFTPVYNTSMTPEQINPLKAAAVAAGLSWEGITDGAYEKWT